MHFVSRWSRRRKLTVGAIAAVMAAGVGIAFALLTLRTPFQGGGEVVAPTASLSVDSVVVMNETAADCTASTDGTQVTIDMAQAVRGEATCTLRVNVAKSANPTALFVQGVEFSAVTGERFTGSSCGREVLTSPTAVDVVLTVPVDAPLGPFTATADVAGITVTDAFSADVCPPGST